MVLKNNFNTGFPVALPLIFSMLFLLFADPVSAASATEMGLKQQEVKVVWAADHGQGEQVFFSSFAKDTWSAPVQISNDTQMAFQPGAASDQDGKIWVVWSRNNPTGSSLEFSTYSNAQWSKPQPINTGLRTNTAAAVIVGNNKIPVIAWTGIDKLYPDIYWSQWNGHGWELPKKVHAENDVPDLQPSLHLDASGNIILVWLTFMDGKYVEVKQVLQQGQWRSDPEQTADLGKRGKITPSVPNIIQDERKATFFIRDSNGAYSVQPPRR